MAEVAMAPRLVSIADALKVRCVLAEVRWRWTLKALGMAFQRIRSAKRLFSMLEGQSLALQFIEHVGFFT